MNAISQTASIATKIEVRKKIQAQRINAMTLILLGLVLVSALGLTYLKDLNRRLLIEYQTYTKVQSQNYLKWSQLLLEQGTLSTQATIQKTANQHLKMFVPQTHNIVMIKLPN